MEQGSHPVINQILNVGFHTSDNISFKLKHFVTTEYFIFPLNTFACIGGMRIKKIYSIGECTKFQGYADEKG